MMLTYDFVINIEKFRKYFLFKKKKSNLMNSVLYKDSRKNEAIQKIIHDIINVR